MKKLFRIVLLVIFVIALAYLLGPKPDKPVISDKLPGLDVSIEKIDEYILKYDSEGEIKPDNRTRILWANDSARQQTEYVMLYLHGFSASWYEGFPANYEFASHFGCNAYFPRLASHGLVTNEPLLDMTPDRLWESAKEALMVSRILGKKVIIMSTSTGGTLGLKLAADFPELVDGLILYSPNIAINNSAAFLLSKNWGLQLGRKVNGGLYRVTNKDFNSKECQYWYCKYRMEGTVFLQQLLDVTMNEKTFSKVKAPVFLAYYYKDEQNQDPTVLVSAMLEMYSKLGTPAELKRQKAYPESGNHVIACELFSKSHQEIALETIRFAEEVLKLTPAEQ